MTRGDPRHLCLFEKCAAHGFEFDYFLAESIFRKLVMIRKAPQAVEIFRAAVDKLPGQGDLILQQDSAAPDATCLISHGKVPGNTDRYAYRVPEQSG